MKWSAALSFVCIPIFLTIKGSTKLSGRIMMLIDPSYSKEQPAMFQSVAEHAPTTLANWWQDCNTLLFFFPMGFYFTLVHKVTHGKLFIGMYGVFIIYFSSCMVRLLIIMVPCMCLMVGIVVSNIIRRSTKGIRYALFGLL